MKFVAVVPRDERRAAVAAWQSVEQRPRKRLFHRPAINGPRMEVTAGWHVANITQAQADAILAAGPDGLRIIRATNIRDELITLGLVPMREENDTEREPPTKKPNLKALAVRQHHLAWMPMDANPPNDFPSLNPSQTGALIDNRQQGVKYTTEAYGDADNRGWKFV